MTNTLRYEILKSLELNGADECEAAAGYYGLICLCERYLVEEKLSPTENQLILEIIEFAKEYTAEEYKHAVGLRDLIIKFSGITPEK